LASFAGKIAVVTGGGTGMGRELVRQLSAEGCHVAMCDVSTDSMNETKALALAECPAGTRVTTFAADVADEAQMLAFAAAVRTDHDCEHINLLFNNAGIGGGGSFVKDDRADWDRTFGVCWFGVYYCTRAFLPLLIASKHAHVVNTSSVNGFWASLGPTIPHTAYSAAKFAVKGFSEALINDLKINAPHVKVAVVMPGHIGTSIVMNTAAVLGKPDALHMSSTDVAATRELLQRRGIPVETMSDDEIREAMHRLAVSFRDNAPVTAAQAATIILDGVRTDRWRILVGDDAERLDERVRQTPETAYTPEFYQSFAAEVGWRLG